MENESQANPKASLRREMKSRFSKVSPTDYRLANSRIHSRFFELPEVLKADVVMLYYSIDREVETVRLIEELLRQAKTVALPVCIPGYNLEARRIKDLSHLQKAGFGLFEPMNTEPVISPEAFDLIVVPGLAFDMTGGRLGHGRGYYDRFLAAAPQAFKLGMAYDFQIVEHLPLAKHDVLMDALLTPSGIKRFNETII